MILPAIIIAISVVTAGWWISTAISECADKLDRINTHGLHVRGYPDKPINIIQDKGEEE